MSGTLNLNFARKYCYLAILCGILHVSSGVKSLNFHNREDVMDKNKLVKKVIVAGLVFNATSMLVACGYGPQTVYQVAPAQTVTQTEMQNVGLEETPVEVENF